MNSCIYEGQVRHERRAPVRHRFRYRVFMMFIDLDELPVLFEGRWFWSAKRAAPARFRRSDHLGPADEPLAESLRRLVEARTGRVLTGPIRLLTHLSYFGYCFNPVSFYYCYRDDGETLDTIVAEVNNTPWGEQHCYVLPRNDEGTGRRPWRFRPSKIMHVSPFMPMDVDYHWSFSEPGQSLGVSMAISREGRRVFDAAMGMRRREITGAALARVLLSYPFMTARVITAIHWQALRLWLKRCPAYVHPSKGSSASAEIR